MVVMIQSADRLIELTMAKLRSGHLRGESALRLRPRARSVCGL
jgi:hypothetical protein